MFSLYYSSLLVFFFFGPFQLLSLECRRPMIYRLLSALIRRVEKLIHLLNYSRKHVAFSREFVYAFCFAGQKFLKNKSESFSLYCWLPLSCWCIGFLYMFMSSSWTKETEHTKKEQKQNPK
jgi:hypothetical protein